MDRAAFPTLLYCHINCHPNHEELLLTLRSDTEHGDSRGIQNGLRFDGDRVSPDHWRRKNISRHSQPSPRLDAGLNFQSREAARILAFLKKLKRSSNAALVDD
jgi:hypothetical protein